jgi:hypothetical protein
VQLLFFCVVSLSASPSRSPPSLLSPSISSSIFSILPLYFFFLFFLFSLFFLFFLLSLLSLLPLLSLLSLLSLLLLFLFSSFLSSLPYFSSLFFLSPSLPGDFRIDLLILAQISGTLCWGKRDAHSLQQVYHLNRPYYCIF